MGGIAMLKLITTNTFAAATTIAQHPGGHGDLHDRGAPGKGAAAGHKRRCGTRLGKGDFLRPLVKGAACSARSWPNYDQICQFDLRASADHVRPVRVLDLERARIPLNVFIASR